MLPCGGAGDIIETAPAATSGIVEDVRSRGTGGAAMARSDFHVALANALDRAMPPEVPQEYDLEAVVDQCIALLERAGWRFTRTRPTGRSSGPGPR